jgi:hypothetical protein
MRFVRNNRMNNSQVLNNSQVQRRSFMKVHHRWAAAALSVAALTLAPTLLLAGLLLASAGAHAAAVLPKITVVGVVGNSLNNVNGYTGTIAYDPSPWFGKAFTLEMTADAAGAVGVSEEIFPGEFLKTWRPITVDYRLTIDGALVFSGTDTSNSGNGTRIETFNDVTIPAGTSGLPPGIVAGHTYDDYAVGVSGIQLGCFDGGANGVCDAPEDVTEHAGIVFDYLWDIAVHNALANDSLPNLLSAAPDFTQGFGSADFNFGHFSQAGGPGLDGSDIARVVLSATSVTVTSTPVPAAVWLLGSGMLGLLGFARRRRIH